MASAAHAENSGFTFTFAMGLRGFHVYRNTENWKPVISQDVRFRREENNEKDRFAVGGFVRIPGRPGRVLVGHIPRELSRYVWHALFLGCQFNASVANTHYKPSPLIQGGLEIELTVKVWWNDERRCSILREHMLNYNFPENEYADESKSILEEIQTSVIEEDSSSNDETSSDDSDVDISSDTSISISDDSDSDSSVSTEASEDFNVVTL